MPVTWESNGDDKVLRSSEVSPRAEQTPGEQLRGPADWGDTCALEVQAAWVLTLSPTKLFSQSQFISDIILF